MEVQQVMVAIGRRLRVLPVLWQMPGHDGGPSRLLLNAMQGRHDFICSPPRRICFQGGSKTHLPKSDKVSHYVSSSVNIA